MEYLNKDFFGNSIQHWIIAFLVLFGSFILVKILYWIFSSVFKNLTSKTKTNLDDILVKNLQKPLTNLVVIGAYYFSVSYLHFDKNIEIILVNIAYLLITITLTSIVSKIFDALISEVILPISKKSETSFRFFRNRKDNF